ncbi:hypothetical protein SCP_1001840 [Sparassis crispa]|uniref:Uncharacterized protein n=1 Tax=Sparassis crispa TaxID=139825 RepID=A0A401GXN4_9APHY|nr:hypothetical protein SCP_1001840 [Sparassis crispa]GBE86940.1 hypothetical protein SCP_1001840 [Sparassis crispa]
MQEKGPHISAFKYPQSYQVHLEGGQLMENSLLATVLYSLLLLAAYRYGFDDDFFSNWRGSVTFVCFDLYVNFPLDREDDSAHQLQEEKCKATRSKCFQTCLHSHLIFVPIFTQPHRYLVFPSLSSDSADNHVASPTPVPDGGLEPAAQAPSLH